MVIGGCPTGDTAQSARPSGVRVISDEGGFGGLASGPGGPGYGGSALAWHHRHKHTNRAGWRMALPLRGRGAGLSLRQAPRYLPYWTGFLLYNGGSMLGEILRPAHKPISRSGNAAWLAAARVAPILTGFLFWALAAFILPPAQIGLGSAAIAAALLTVQPGMPGIGSATLTLLPRETDGGRRLMATALLTVGAFSLVAAGTLLATTHWVGSGVGAAWHDPLMAAFFLATVLFAASDYQPGPMGVAQERTDRAFVLSLPGPQYAAAWVRLPLLVPALLPGSLAQSAVAVAGRRLFMLTR